MARRIPSLESLRVFEVAARCGNFTRAASELCVTPTAVSLRVRDLETELGVALFHRNGPRIEVTEVGKALAAGLAVAMSTIVDAVHEVDQAARVVRISTAPTFAAKGLAPLLADYPIDSGVVVSVRSTTDVDPPADFDIAIRSGLGPWPGLRSVASVPIRTTPMLALSLAGEGALTNDDLLALPLLHDERWAQWFELRGIDPRRARFAGVEYPTQNVMAEAAIAGAGVALLSPDLFASLITEGRLIRPFTTCTQGPDAWHLLAHEGEQRPHVLALTEWLSTRLER